MTTAAILGTKRPGSDEIANMLAAFQFDRTALSRMFGAPWRHIDATTDSNTAAASSPLINLTDEGVAFDTDTIRKVTVATIAANGSNRFMYATEQWILGGTNPTLYGPESFLTDCSAVLQTALASSGTTTTENTNCKAPGWWDGAAPAVGVFSSGLATAYFLGGTGTPALPCRAILPISGQFSHATSSIANTRNVGLHNPAIATASIDLAIADLATPSASSADGTLTVFARVLPPIWTPVLIDTSPTPDKVFIGALGLSSDLVTWSVDVFLGDPIKLPLL